MQKKLKLILKNPGGKASKHKSSFYLNYLQFFLQTPPHRLHFFPPWIKSFSPFFHNSVYRNRSPLVEAAANPWCYWEHWLEAAVGC